MPETDPEFAAAVAAAEDAEMAGLDWSADPPERLRAAYAAARARLEPDIAPGCRIWPIALDGAEGLLFEPEKDLGTGCAIVFFHGGSWVVGSPWTHRVICSRLATAAGMAVYSIRYRLAPEHPFPAQREDGVAAVAALLSAPRAPSRLVLAGDSAGAAVAFWTDAALPRDLRARIAGVAGFYGAYGLIPEAAETAGGDGLSPGEIRAAYARLGPPDRLAAMPGFAIAREAPGDGAPCYLAAGTADPLTGDTAALAEHLRAAGRDVTVETSPGLGHSFLHYAGRVGAAGRALERAARWMAERAD